MLPSRRASARASGIRKRLVIACLSVIQKHYWKLRLGLVAMFMAIFAAVIGHLTNARRADIFSSTAAYAAVLVVFVSGNLGPDATAGNWSNYTGVEKACALSLFSCGQNSLSNLPAPSYSVRV